MEVPTERHFRLLPSRRQLLASLYSSTRATSSDVKIISRVTYVLVLSLTSILLVTTPEASAHQPLILRDSDTTAAKGPLIVDGTVSFAVRATFSKAGQVRAFRAQFRDNDQLSIQYLITDKKPENGLVNSLLPVVSIVLPSGVRTTLEITERTSFFEPFSRTNYFYLARYSAPASTGIYKIVITSKAKSSVTIAIGEKEIQGQVDRGNSSVIK